MDKVGQPGWPVIRPHDMQDRLSVIARSSVAGGRIMGQCHTSSSPHRRLISLHWQKYNKSLHPIWSVVQAFATCSLGAANAWPPAQTGELNRYPCISGPFAPPFIALSGFQSIVSCPSLLGAALVAPDYTSPSCPHTNIASPDNYDPNNYN